jgi:hypothetical protein
LHGVGLLLGEQAIQGVNQVTGGGVGACRFGGHAPPPGVTVTSTAGPDCPVELQGSDMSGVQLVERVPPPHDIVVVQSL